MVRLKRQGGFGIPRGAVNDGGIGFLLACHAESEQRAGGEGEIVRAGGRLGFAGGGHILATRELRREFG